jgi:hypothetical protein
MDSEGGRDTPVGALVEESWRDADRGATGTGEMIRPGSLQDFRTGFRAERQTFRMRLQCDMKQAYSGSEKKESHLAMRRDV